MEVVSFYQSAWLYVLGERLIVLLKDFPFTLEVLDKDFNIIHYILTYTFDFYQGSAYITHISCEFQISAL
jgi:hypothetical protein